MAGGHSVISGMAGRYASALYELARDGKAVDKVMAELDDFAKLLDMSADMTRLVESPVFTAGEQSRAVSAILVRAGIKGLTANFIGLVARNRRLFAIRDMIRTYREIVARERGEITAQLVSAVRLDDAQIDALKAAIKQAMDAEVQIDATVDESVLGGMLVRVGSRQIDTTIRSKLNNLRIALKEVG